ncbi:MAG: hypothetical protein AABW59_03220 [archaeon]
MKISLVGIAEPHVAVFKDMAKNLSKRISGLELEERFAPTLEDLPFLCAECAAESDFVFAFALVEDEAEVKYMKDKLVDVEIKTETRILKAIEEDDLSSLDEDEYYEAKEALVKKYCDLIVDVLFNERSFEPEDKDFSE